MFFFSPAEFYRSQHFNYSKGYLEFLIYTIKFYFNTFGGYLEKRLKNPQFILSLGISNSLLLIEFEMALLSNEIYDTHFFCRAGRTALASPSERFTALTIPGYFKPQSAFIGEVEKTLSNALIFFFLLELQTDILHIS